MVKSLPAKQEIHDSISGSGRPPGKRNDYLVFLPGEFHGRRNLAGCKESNMTE